MRPWRRPRFYLPDQSLLSFRLGIDEFRVWRIGLIPQQSDERETTRFFAVDPEKLRDPFPDLAYFRERKPVSWSHLSAHGFLTIPTLDTSSHPGIMSAGHYLAVYQRVRTR